MQSRKAISDLAEQINWRFWNEECDEERGNRNDGRKQCDLVPSQTKTESVNGETSGTPDG